MSSAPTLRSIPRLARRAEVREGPPLQHLEPVSSAWEAGRSWEDDPSGCMGPASPCSREPLNVLLPVQAWVGGRVQPEVGLTLNLPPPPAAFLHRVLQHPVGGGPQK